MNWDNLSYIQNHSHLRQEVTHTWWVLVTHYNDPPQWLTRLCVSIQFYKTEIHHHTIS